MMLVSFKDLRSVWWQTRDAIKFVKSDKRLHVWWCSLIVSSEVHRIACEYWTPQRVWCCRAFFFFFFFFFWFHQEQFLWEKVKMANVMNLNWSKGILVVDIPTQILLTIIIHWSFAKMLIESLNINSHQRGTIYDKLIFFAKLVRERQKPGVSKIWGRMSTTNILLLQLKI